MFSLKLISKETLFPPIGNSMIFSDIWRKYHEWYLKIVTNNFRQFWNITSGNYAKYHVQIMLLFVYTTTRKRFVIFTCRYFKLSWNTTALSQSNCRNFSCSSIQIWFPSGKRWLANNMTIQGNVRLCKWGGGWRLVKWMSQALFFLPRAKEAKKSKMKKAK